MKQPAAWVADALHLEAERARRDMDRDERLGRAVCGYTCLVTALDMSGRWMLKVLPDRSLTPPVFVPE